MAINPTIRSMLVCGIGERALEFEAARIEELKARQDKRKLMREIHLDGGEYCRGDNDEADIIMDSHKARAKVKANARARLSREIKRFHRTVATIESTQSV